MKRLVDAAKAGRIALNPQTKHLARSAGSCVFCTMLEIGPCDYKDEIRPLVAPPMLHAAGAPDAVAPDKQLQRELLAGFVAELKPQRAAWSEVEAGGEE